jgi:hypothetical protein
MKPIGANCQIKWNNPSYPDEDLLVNFKDFDENDDIFYCTLEDIQTKPFPCDDFEIISYTLIYERE